jgi:polysaccharide export outer membrane protein
MNKTVYCWILCLVCFGCGHVAAQNSGKEHEGLAEMASVVPRTLGIGDQFRTRIFGEPEISEQYRVPADGQISFPLIGAVPVIGLTADQLTKILTEKLSAYLKDPNVYVAIENFSSQKIHVLGQVQRPGTFAYDSGMSIIEAITLAGGFAGIADRDAVYVTRTIDGAERRLKISVKSIGEARTSNFLLRPGDIIYVNEALF